MSASRDQAPKCFTVVKYEESIEHCRARKDGGVGFPKGQKVTKYQCGSERWREGGVIGCSDSDGRCLASRVVSEVEERFNLKFNYPWIFLNDEPFSDKFERYVLHVSPFFLNGPISPHVHLVIYRVLYPGLCIFYRSLMSFGIFLRGSTRPRW